MSELREECYKCLNNQSCPGSADYGSIVCMTMRKFKMPRNHEKDSVYATKFAVMQQQINEKDKRIKELEEENKRKDMFVEMAKEVIENSIPKQKIKDLLTEIQEEYNKVQEQFDCIWNKKSKDDYDRYKLQEFSTMQQQLGFFIGKLEELLEEK